MKKFIDFQNEAASDVKNLTDAQYNKILKDFDADYDKIVKKLSESTLKELETSDILFDIKVLIDEVKIVKAKKDHYKIYDFSTKCNELLKGVEKILDIIDEII